MNRWSWELELRAEAEIEKVLEGVTIAGASVVGEHVLVVGAVDADAYDRVAVVAEGAHARQLARYLKAAHGVACLEQIGAIEAQSGQFELTIEVLIL